MTRFAAFSAALLLLLAWDVTAGGRIAQRRAELAPFRLLSGVCGFLVAPALLVSVGGDSALTARALEGLGWLWPAVLLLFVAQSAHALHRRVVSASVGVPILAFNLLLAFAAVTRYAGSLGRDVPIAAYTPGLALANVLAFALGASTFASPLAVMVPVLAPGRRVDAPLEAYARAAVACFAGAAGLLVCAAAFPAHAALNAYGLLGTERATELIGSRERGSFLTGLRVLPELTRVPAATALRDDLALADSIGIDALMVRVAPEGCTAAVLDSLDRALEPFRRDSGLLIVTLTYSRGSARELRASDSGYTRRRAADVDRIVRRLKPDYLVPADAPFGSDASVLGRLSVAWWQRFVTATALAAHRARPATRVVLTSGAAGVGDSLLFRWATEERSPVDVTAFSIVPGVGGALQVLTTLATADRWMRTAASAREHWLIASGAPTLESEEAQRRLVRHVLLWAAARPHVRGVVLADAADYDRATGLRATGGRLRRATAEAAATIRVLAGPSSLLP